MKVSKFILPLILILCLFFVGQAYSQDKVITDPSDTLGFTWDANTETNLAGYRLYYAATRAELDASNFTLGVGVTQVPVIIAADKTEIEIDPLPVNGDYYFCLTAYNALGNESGPSDATCCLVRVAYPPETPANPVGFGCLPAI